MNNDEAYDELLHRSNGAMIVVTAHDGKHRAGCLVGFHSQAGIEPRRHAVWLSMANMTFRVALHSSHLAVHFLGADDKELARRFGEASGDERDKFDGLDWAPGPGGAPVLAALPDRFVGHRVAMFDAAGDHACFILAPEQAELSADAPEAETRPLRVAQLDDLVPGHEVEERPVPADVNDPSG